MDVAEYVAPNTYDEAMSSTDAAQWARAVQEELRAHENNQTWSIIPRTPKQKIIDSKWVFRVKKDPESGDQRFKARSPSLCAKSFMQRQGIDFTETFAPVVRYDSLRVLLVTVAERDLELLQFDVRTAFLYGELSEDIFMEIPEGVNIKEEGRRSVTKSIVCKLKKSLYGLKQAPRCWNQKFTKFLSQYEFVASEADECVFIGKFESKDVYLALFVDDGLMAAESKAVLDVITSELSKSFKITIGDAKVFVGLQIKRNKDTKLLSIHQAAYTAKVIERFGMSSSKATGMPADPHTALLPVENDEQTVNVPYREAIGFLLFLAIVSRPDIAFAVNTVSKITTSRIGAR